MVAYNAAIDACSGRWLEAVLLNRELLQRGDAGRGCLGNRNGMNTVEFCIISFDDIERSDKVHIVILPILCCGVMSHPSSMLERSLY